jgi:protein-L-isoaspartate(D-aspartate) O-methyltransferase
MNLIARPNGHRPPRGNGGFMLSRRDVVVGAASVLAAACLPRSVAANVPVPYDPKLTPPLDTRAGFVAWMQKNRGEDPNFLGQRWDRLQALLAHQDLWDKRNERAYLLTPREDFVTKANLDRAYEWHYLDIGFGVSITGPHTVARMTNSIDVQSADKVLEIGTGSGYQSAYLSNLSPTRCSRSRSLSYWQKGPADYTTR